MATAVLLMAATPARAFNIASFGEARAVIVTGKDTSPVVKTMAAELTNYLDRIVVGAKFKISEHPVGGKNTIRLGTPYTGKPDEFAVFINKRGELELTGTPPRGTVYAAYALLEEFGCRFWTPDEETVPQTNRLALAGNFRRVEAPAWERRPICGEGGYYCRWRAKNRLTAGNWYTCPPELGGESGWEAGETLPLGNISPKKYFQDHPDWYALRFLPGMKAPGATMVAVAEGKTDETRPAGDYGRSKGILVRDSTQVCLTHPEMVRTLIDVILLNGAHPNHVGTRPYRS